MEIKHLFKHLTYSVFAPSALLRDKYNAFRSLLKYDNQALDFIADFEDIFYGNDIVDWARVGWIYNKISLSVRSMIEQLQLMSPTKHLDLIDYFKKIDFYVRLGLDIPVPYPGLPYVISLSEALVNSDISGGKALNLSKISQDLSFNVPSSFVVTINAFHYFIESNELRPKIDKLLRQASLSNLHKISDISSAIQSSILEASVPDDLEQAIRHSVSNFMQGHDSEITTFAVRSSAVAEDGEFSFAGQYSSELNIPPEDIVSAYVRVLSSKYSEKALTYRIKNGLSDQETPMAVLIMPMVESLASGVVYTVDMDEKEGQSLAIYVVPGQCSFLVDGSFDPEVYYFSRADLVPSQTNSTNSLLTSSISEQIFEKSLVLESFFDSPLDIEWVIDKNGVLWFLQARPLQITPDFHDQTLSEPDVSISPSLEGGICASSGIASGIVLHVDSVLDVATIPVGSVLVVQTLTPSLSRLIGQVGAVVARSGSRASHFASIARENNLPVVTGFSDPFTSLKSGSIVTVHADRGKVYPGKVEELVSYGESIKSAQIDSPLSQRLAPIVPMITQLNLTDPDSPEFSPKHSRSMHDLVRYCHEQSVREMFSLVGKGSRSLSKAKKLKSTLPIVMYVLDLEDGIFSGAAAKPEITPDDIQSLPMWAFWFGLSSEDVPWDSSLLHVDWEEMDRIAAGIFSHDSKLLASYAIISKDYLHMMIRFGYHFSVLDSFCSGDINSNYINFRFKGGGGEYNQRILRLELIRRVLLHFGFSIQVRGDMLDASLSKHTEISTQKNLAFLGYLLARTRLMDMGLHNEEQINELVQDFLNHQQDFSK